MQLSKKCKVCGQKYFKKGWTSVKNWNLSRYCSRVCLDKSKIGNDYKKGKKVGTSWNKGKKLHYQVWNKGSDGEYARKLGFGKWMKGRRGEQIGNWKGEKVGYTALHDWVRRWKGTPEKCEFCGKDGLKGQQIHWASKSFEYKRDLEDWIRLCAKCHQNYDRNNNNWGGASKKYKR